MSGLVFPVQMRIPSSQALEQPGVSWLDGHWPFVFAALAPVAVLYLARRCHIFSSFWKPQWLVFVVSLVGVMDVVHQLEVHGVDAKGRRYSFHEFHNMQTAPYWHTYQTLIGLALTMFVTVLFVRDTRGPYSLLPQRRWLWHAMACQWATEVVNYVVHIVGAVLANEYNPGTLTAVFMLPWATLVVYLLSEKFGRELCVGALLFGLAVHVPLYMSMDLRRFLLHDPSLSVPIIVLAFCVHLRAGFAYLFAQPIAKYLTKVLNQQW